MITDLSIIDCWMDCSQDRVIFSCVQSYMESLLATSDALYDELEHLFPVPLSAASDSVSEPGNDFLSFTVRVHACAKT